MAPQYSTFNRMEELVDDRQPIGMDAAAPQSINAANNAISLNSNSAKPIDAILDDIIEHLKADQNYNNKHANHLITIPLRLGQQQQHPEGSYERSQIGRIGPQSDGESNAEVMQDYQQHYWICLVVHYG